MFLTVIRRKFFKELTITGIVLTALVGGIYYWIIPHRYFPWFPAIPIFFYIIGLLYIELVSFFYRVMPDKLLMCYMMCKGMKFGASVFMMVGYGILVKHNITTFILTFLFFFFAFLIFETKFFIRFELKLKNRKNSRNEKITVHSTPSDTSISGDTGNESATQR